jgi:hypothetical protein
MGVDTYCYLLNVNRQQLFDFIKIINPSATIIDSDTNSEVATIYYKFHRVSRLMSSHDTVIDVEKDEAQTFKKYKRKHESDSWGYVKDKLPDKTSGVHLSTGYWAESVAFMKLICSYL